MGKFEYILNYTVKIIVCAMCLLLLFAFIKCSMDDHRLNAYAKEHSLTRSQVEIIFNGRDNYRTQVIDNGIIVYSFDDDNYVNYYSSDIIWYMGTRGYKIVDVFDNKLIFERKKIGELK